VPSGRDSEKGIAGTEPRTFLSLSLSLSRGPSRYDAPSAARPPHTSVWRPPLGPSPFSVPAPRAKSAAGPTFPPPAEGLLAFAVTVDAFAWRSPPGSVSPLPRLPALPLCEALALGGGRLGLALNPSTPLASSTGPCNRPKGLGPMGCLGRALGGREGARIGFPYQETPNGSRERLVKTCPKSGWSFKFKAVQQLRNWCAPSIHVPFNIPCALTDSLYYYYARIR